MKFKLVEDFEKLDNVTADDSSLLEHILSNVLLIHIVDDVSNYHFVTDELIYEDNNNIEQYPDERLLSLNDDELTTLPLDKIHQITNTELLERIYHIGKNLLSLEQKDILSNLYSHDINIMSPKLVEALLRGLQSCKSIQIEPTRKNLNFMRTYNLSLEDLRELFSQVRPSDYVQNNRSTNFNHLGNNLMVFHVKNAHIDNLTANLKLYIKIDIDKTHKDCILAISFHELNVYN